MQALATTLGGQRPIAFNTNLARVSGDVKAGLFLSQLLYWTRVGVDVDARQGWIFKTREQWERETGMSRAEQETARHRLTEMRLIEESRFGAPARLGFRIIPAALGLEISRLLRREPVQWTLFELRSEQHIRALLGRNMAFYKVYVDTLGSVPLAIFVTKALAIQKNLLAAQMNKEGHSKVKNPQAWQQNWFSLSMDQWQQETGLRAGQLRKCKQDLYLQEILQEATQTWPRKRQFIRLDLAKLNDRLAQNLAAQLQGHAAHLGPPAGLLQTLMGRVGMKPVVGGADMPGTANNVRTGSLGTSTNIVRTSLPLAFGITDVGAQSLRTWATDDSDARVTPTKLGTPAWADLTHDDPAALPAAQSLRTSSRVAHSANPVSDFLYASRTVPAPGMASLSSTSGELLQSQRRVLAPLHARAVLGLHLQTTTTTTSPPPIAPRGALSVKTTRRSVVVVSSMHSLPGAVESPTAVAVSPLPSQPTSESQATSPDTLQWLDCLQRSGLSAAMVDGCQKLLQRVPPARRLDLVDELRGRMRNGSVRQPVSYLRNLVTRDAEANWDLVLEVAHEERERREGHAAAEQRQKLSDDLKRSWATHMHASNMRDGNDAAAAAARAATSDSLPKKGPSDEMRTELEKLRATFSHIPRKPRKP